ncbi:hypothetical protein ABZ419_13845 [Streptomyces cinnamoneus]|uniref:hypothetical protein n=1 Tax=Streptomyces cinnamoneus TaxID=53446 RepID=UPI0033F9D435
MSAHQERLQDVVAATVEVAAESGQEGVFTDEVARALTAVVGKIAVKAVADAEVDGFVNGWQEAVAVLGDKPATARGAQVYRMPSSGADI